jgi:molybdenum cofactor synthesis domain-containing protein
MPREGVFAEVLAEGVIRPGDEMTVELPAADRPFTAAVITLSDKGARGERVDESGPAAVSMLEEAGYEIVETMIIPDEPLILKKELIRLADQRSVDLVITSGGTGFSMRDRTPEATMEVADRNAPGIAEYIRMRSMQITDRAMLSRGASVIRKGTLIVNLPGSPKAVRESLSFILHSLDHGLKILRGSATECARK